MVGGLTVGHEEREDLLSLVHGKEEEEEGDLSGGDSHQEGGASPRGGGRGENDTDLPEMRVCRSVHPPVSKQWEKRWPILLRWSTDWEKSEKKYAVRRHVVLQKVPRVKNACYIATRLVEYNNGGYFEEMKSFTSSLPAGLEHARVLKSHKWKWEKKNRTGLEY